MCEALTNFMLLEMVKNNLLAQCSTATEKGLLAYGFL